MSAPVCRVWDGQFVTQHVSVVSVGVSSIRRVGVGELVVAGPSDTLAHICCHTTALRHAA